ncbi:hypothetical protein [Aquimarina sp. 2201CG5-10]|uniref:hypothetical protein n=1 Tax=Aquimarina callyspongiae TaxID=3098150 RepID=UPI002AB3F1A4|nr:hypothetical protein [Aquimarina sp. 2201CG5-10]MDY8138304.1 hypothetical protein [Aquimarina sp. 2201CG5-10]
MKVIFYNKLILIIFCLCSGTHLLAQERVSKKIEKSFDFTNAGKLKLENKYGNIKINGWDQNEIAVTIDIVVTKKDKDDAKELLERIKPFINKASNSLIIFLNIEEKSNNFFSRMLNKANPFDFDKGSVQIDYTIHLPLNATVQVKNKFGDIIINDWNGKLKANLHHGDMYINNDLTDAAIEMKFGKLQTKSITYGDLQLKNSELDIETIKDLKINSNGSTIAINNIANLEIYSSKDKITIKNLERVQGELRFSNMILEQLEEDINLYMEVSDFYVNKILNRNPNIVIKQKSSELNINISDISFDFNASLEQGLLRIPKSFKNIKNNVIDDKKRLRDITATYGSNDLKGKFQITGKKGVIILKE